MPLVNKALINDLRKRIDVSSSVAYELLILAGGDVDLAEEASKNSKGLSQCKAYILDARLRAIEDELWESEE